MNRSVWERLYSKRSQWMASSIIREILKFAQRPDIISLAGGWPDAGLFPVEQISQIVGDVLQAHPGDALQYGLTEGYLPLRTSLADQISQYGINASSDNLVMTSGSQQALDLIGRVFIDPGDVILVEKPTYLGAIQAWRAYGARFETIAIDDAGMRTDLLEEILKKHRPKLIYTMPNFHNPAGVTMTLERREHLVALAGKYSAAIVEDDPYGQLRYEGEHLPPLVTFDGASGNRAGEAYTDGHVIYLATFSKTLAPGLRLGWVVAPAGVARKIVMAKQGADLHSSALSQVIAYEFLKRELLPFQVRRIRDTYKERLYAMLEAMEDCFPPSVRWTRPSGGLFLWVVLPEDFDSVELLREALDTERVAFVPGTAFYADASGQNTLRLTFASSPPDIVREGVKRLGRAISRRIDQ